jgi:hypothetical protein
LLEDEERKERIKKLAKIADERWLLKGQQPVERLAVGGSDEILKGTTMNSRVDIASSRTKTSGEKGYSG